MSDLQTFADGPPRDLPRLVTPAIYRRRRGQQTIYVRAVYLESIDGYIEYISVQEDGQEWIMNTWSLINQIDYTRPMSVQMALFE